MAALKFVPTLEASDPLAHPVTIVGQVDHLRAVPYNAIKHKLEPRVKEEIYKMGLVDLTPSPTDSCPLFLNLATLIALPKSCSRHNTTSRAHSITKVVKTNLSYVDESIVIVCEQDDMFASACAVARAFPLYSRKSKQSGNCTVTVQFIVVGPNNTIDLSPIPAESLDLFQNAATAIRNAGRIIDMPCNEMHTDQFVQEAIQIGNELGISPVIIRDTELDQRGFGGIYSVGQASVHPPSMVVLSHLPKGAEVNVAWVGKGIVYDTGGLSIKSKTGMPTMKRDCGGAAGILNAFYVAVKQGFKQNLHAVLCLAENSVGPKSTRPDDIITMYSGKTVEVNNTDAEGRLVLGDGVAYAKKDLKADIIVDMATLTGAQGVSTGKYHAAILTNSEPWERYAMKAGNLSGDLAFPIVFAPELHFSEFNSTVADMKNSAADRNNALSSCAGLFIMSHIGFDFPGIWMHIDMASPGDSGDRGTGYGVALLNTLFGHYSSNPVLNKLSPVNA